MKPLQPLPDLPEAAKARSPHAASVGMRRIAALWPRALRAAALSAALALAGGLAVCAPAGAPADAVSLEHARAEHEAGRAVLIDIREPEEHATGVAAGARLLPMRQLGRRLSEIPIDPAQPVLLICHTQNRSSAALRALRERGYGHVRYVDGGMNAWARRGWPMVRPGTSP